MQRPPIERAEVKKDYIGSSSLPPHPPLPPLDEEDENGKVDDSLEGLFINFDDTELIHDLPLREEDEIPFAHDSAVQDISPSDVALSDKNLVLVMEEELQQLKADGVEIPSEKLDKARVIQGFQKVIDAGKNQEAENIEEEERIEAGVGEPVRNLSIFDEIGDENEFGLRKIKWKGKYNLLDRENRLILPMKTERWPDEVTAVPLKSQDQKEIALVRIEGKSFLLKRGGMLIDATLEEMKSSLTLKVLAEEESKTPLSYFDDFLEKLTVYNELFGRLDAIIVTVLNLLGKELADLKEEMSCIPELNWEMVIIGINERVQKSNLRLNVKTLLYLELWGAAGKAGLNKERDHLFALSELIDYGWLEWGVYKEGVIVQIYLEDGVKYSLVHNDKLLYPIDKAFDSIGIFTNKVALVKRGDESNFIKWEDGQLVCKEEWFLKIYEEREGIFRVKRKNGKFNYIDSHDAKFISETDFDNAEDFAVGGCALVSLNNEKFFIDKRGERVTSVIDIGITKVMQKRAQKPISDLDELKEDVKEEAADIRKSQVNYKLHDLFKEFKELSPSPKENEELIKLFGAFRQAINKEIESGEKDKIELKKVLNSLLAESELSRLEIREKLEQFISSLGNKELRWNEAIKPLPILLLTTFEDFIRNCRPDEEAELIKLLRRIENEVINMHPMDARQNLIKLFPAIQKQIQDSRLSQSTKNKVGNMVLKMTKNKDVYWMSGHSVDSYIAKTKSGRKVQRRHARMKRKRRITLLPKERFYLRRKFDQLCRSAKTGSYKTAYRQYQELITRYPRHKFDHKKFGKAIYKYARGLSEEYQKKKNLNLLTSLLDAEIKALIVFKRALRANPNDSSIYRYINVLKKELGKKEYKKAIENGLRKNPNRPNLLKLRRELLPFAKRSRMRLKVFLILICGCAAGAAVWHFRSDITQFFKKVANSDQLKLDLDIINKLSPRELRELTDQIKRDPALRVQYRAYISDFRRTRNITGEWKAKQLIQCRREFLRKMANHPEIASLLEKFRDSKRIKKKRQNHK